MWKSILLSVSVKECWEKVFFFFYCFVLFLFSGEARWQLTNALQTESGSENSN